MEELKDMIKKGILFFEKNQQKKLTKNYIFYESRFNDNDNIISVISIKDHYPANEKFNWFKPPTKSKLKNNIMIGCLTKLNYQKLIDKYIEIRKTKFKKVKKYFKQNPESKIHFSNNIDIILNTKNKDIKGTYFDNRDWDIAFVSTNPNGLWYACDISFYEYIEKQNRTKDKNRSDINLETWILTNMYKLNLDKLNICKISTCKELKEFSMKYKNKKYNWDARFGLDYKRVKKDYDGLELCPFITLNCSGVDKYLKKSLINYPFYIIKVLFNEDLTLEEKSTIWSLGWDGSTGVIWKNMKKVNYEQITLI